VRAQAQNKIDRLQQRLHEIEHGEGLLR